MCGWIGIDGWIDNRVLVRLNLEALISDVEKQLCQIVHEIKFWEYVFGNICFRL